MPVSILGESPYILAYQLAMIQCAWAMQELGTGDRVAFVCDECEQYSATAQQAYVTLKATNPRAAAYMATYSTEDEKRCDPLQAADAVVYEIRIALGLALGQRRGYFRRQFDILEASSVMFLIQTANREQLQRIVGTHRPGEPFNLDELMDQSFSENIRFGDSTGHVARI